MLNRSRHENIMNRIVHDIYTHPQLRSLLGFKGGTACYFLYNLPRFSTDLDFNLLDVTQSDLVFETIQRIVEQYGTMRQSYQKRFTIFSLLSYEIGSQTIKVEISKRAFEQNRYSTQYYLGIPILVLEKPFLTAHKFATILDRRKIMNRDLFDAHFFLKENWPIDAATIRLRTGKNLPDYFIYLADTLEKHGSQDILQGIGELITEKQKAWVKTKLLPDLLFYLRSYSASLKRNETD
ncbi:MAG: nucleotidyl transferase AbiEii/AbiGii toxin family protein [Candidatus Kerfeldbacteria bacterium]|nr:nucleotidyl transferase AbiEii/AbiGii toxin family protein [Candidatus Kerfeldbacteria bacterium]